jgi:hypothetical protein
MPKASGSTPPPMPWIARATTSTVTSGARAASGAPADSAISAATKTRFFPNTSPTRPMIGVQTEADRRYAVNTQATAERLVPSSVWIVPSTGVTSDWSSE